MNISLIVAMGRNGVIGQKGRMPWHLPAEMAYFKKVTMGHTIVMGRKTFEAIGNALPGRRNIILARSTGFKAENCEVIHSLNELMELLKKIDDEVFVIGGEEVFNQFYKYTNKIYLTIIDHDFEGDRFFKPINFEKWKLMHMEEYGKDKQNKYSFTCYVYMK